MFKIPTILASDFYKQTHTEQYNPYITFIKSYYTPRMSRHDDVDSVVVFGLSSTIRDYLIDDFKENFFDLPLDSVLEQYTEIIQQTLGLSEEHLKNAINRITSLHKLGYLPLSISGLEEGRLCPIGCPMFSIENTHKDFAWLVNNIETNLSAELWYTMCVATMSTKYRKIVNYWYDLTSDVTNTKSAMSEFGYRGLIGRAGAIKASSGFLLSFDKTSNIPAISYLNYHYGDSLSTIGTGMVSTEHSVMCSDFMIDGDEMTGLIRLLKKYPTGNISIVCDSYDYWNVLTSILPKLKSEIIDRDGCLFVRGDSGDIVEIVVDSVRKLYEFFPGKENTKGYLTLDPHIRVVYGDSVTPFRAYAIYEKLKKYLFAADNVILGAGSFSMLCEDTKNGLKPYTRDSFGVAIKTQYCEVSDGNTITGIDIVKSPKTDTDNFKTSAKGNCLVYETTKEELKFIDEINRDFSEIYQSEYISIFHDGRMINQSTLEEVRRTLWNGKF